MKKYCFIFFILFGSLSRAEISLYGGFQGSDAERNSHRRSNGRLVDRSTTVTFSPTFGVGWGIDFIGPIGIELAGFYTEKLDRYEEIGYDGTDTKDKKNIVSTSYTQVLLPASLRLKFFNILYAGMGYYYSRIVGDFKSNILNVDLQTNTNIRFQSEGPIPNHLKEDYGWTANLGLGFSLILVHIGIDFRYFQGLDTNEDPDNGDKTITKDLMVLGTIKLNI